MAEAVETATTKVQNDITTAMDIGLMAILVSLGSSATFDAVDFITSLKNII